MWVQGFWTCWAPLCSHALLFYQLQVKLRRVPEVLECSWTWSGHMSSLTTWHVVIRSWHELPSESWTIFMTNFSIFTFRPYPNFVDSLPHHGRASRADLTTAIPTGPHHPGTDCPSGWNGRDNHPSFWFYWRELAPSDQHSDEHEAASQSGSDQAEFSSPPSNPPT